MTKIAIKVAKSLVDGASVIRFIIRFAKKSPARFRTLWYEHPVFTARNKMDWQLKPVQMI